MNTEIHTLTICIKGAGEIASAVAWRLYRANLRRIFLLERPDPLSVRRQVSYCEAIHAGRHTVEGVDAVKVESSKKVDAAWSEGAIAVLVDPSWNTLRDLTPNVCVDAIMAKRNLGTTLAEAPLVIGLGPGFIAGQNVHMVIETNRGHNLGRIITSGSAEANTGVPGPIEGYTEERVLRASADGRFHTTRKIGERIAKGEVVGNVAGHNVSASIDGILRGLIRPDTRVRKGFKIGDIDPRGVKKYCYTISDKARAVGGSVLEAILRVYLAPSEG
jgi:xanthine dehydrogenase accessory factor